MNANRLSNYLNSLKNTISVARDQISPEVFCLLSIPTVLCLNEAYWDAPVRVMIMGQETLGVESTLSGIPVGTAGWFQDFFVGQMAEYDDFDFAYGSRHERGPFWRGYQEVVDAFGLPSRRATAWSNICKVQLVEPHPKTGAYSISALSARQQMEIVRWQKELFLAEIAFAQPHCIMMFTGGLSWINTHMFTSNGPAEKSDVSWKPIAGTSPAHGFVVAPKLDADRLIVAHSSHPNSRLAVDGQYRRAVLAELTRAVRSR